MVSLKFEVAIIRYSNPFLFPDFLQVTIRPLSPIASLLLARTTTWPCTTILSTSALLDWVSLVRLPSNYCVLLILEVPFSMELHSLPVTMIPVL